MNSPLGNLGNLQVLVDGKLVVVWTSEKNISELLKRQFVFGQARRANGDKRLTNTCSFKNMTAHNIGHAGVANSIV